MKHQNIINTGRFKKPQYEIGAIFRDNFNKAGRLSKDHRKVINDLINCRTEILGGHKLRCHTCGYIEISYNSCRNRHCPKCQHSRRLKWLSERMEEVLPVKYFHIVFTIPAALNPLVLQNKEVLYNILFKSAKETLLEAAANTSNLGAKIGFMAVLHTWGQNLLDHPHLHCVVTGGGLSPDGTGWISCRDNFFIAVKILSKLFRGKFLYYLKKSFNERNLEFHGKLEDYRYRERFNELMRESYSKQWVVYTKKPFNNPRSVFEYLGRYTHRVAISNGRITYADEENVSFRWKDYRDGNKKKIMTVSTEEFMRRFLLHVLPKGFKRIRFYGIMSNKDKKERLRRIKSFFEIPIDETEREDTLIPELAIVSNEGKLYTCPRCGGNGVSLEVIPSYYERRYYKNTS